jgi:hypothetical protein
MALIQAWPSHLPSWTMQQQLPLLPPLQQGPWQQQGWVAVPTAASHGHRCVMHSMGVQVIVQELLVSLG